MRPSLILAPATLLLAVSLLASPTPAQNCSQTSVGLTPLSDLGAGLYQGFPGGLYPGGQNQRPPAHDAAGLAQAALVVPRDAAGQPDPANGRIVLMSIGMSNAVREFGAFIPQAQADPALNPQVVLVNGAQGGQAAEDIADPAAPYWNGVDAKLAAAGVTPLQVQAIWLKEANRGPTDPFPQHAQNLQGQLQTIVQIIRDRYPNARLCYHASRIYAGYAVTTLNPEPWAYESGFSVKWLIEDQIQGDPALNFDPALGAVMAPWLSWGPYTWADGLTPRSDGLTWECADFDTDGTHPSPQGADKVAGMLLDFLKTDPTAAPWFATGGGGDVLRLSQRDLHRGQPAEFRVMEAGPGETVHFLYSLAGTGMGPCPPVLGGLCLDLLAPVVDLATAVADGRGIARVTVTVPAGAPLADVSTQAVAARGPGGVDSVKSNTITAPILP